MRGTRSSRNHPGAGLAGLAIVIVQAFGVGAGCVAMESPGDGAPLALSSGAALAQTSGTGGDTIAFQREGHIWLMNQDGTGMRPLQEGEQPAWSPDGIHLAGRCYGVGIICLFDVRNGYFVALTDNGSNWSPTFSPDGSKIAYVSDWNIWVMDAADGGNKTQLTFFPPGVGFMTATPSFSPDGSRIAFGSPSRHITVMNADGSDQQQVMFAGLSDPNPVWSPDGTKLAFFRIPPGPETEAELQLTTVHADGTFGATPKTVTLVGGFHDGIAWSPDSARLAYGRNSQVHIRDLTTGQTQIVNASEDIGQPAWEPATAPAGPDGATPVGARVSVDLDVVTVQFAHVTSPGTTTVVPRPWYEVGGPGVFALQGGASTISLEIQTTATYQGPVTVTLDVPGDPSRTDFALTRVIRLETDDDGNDVQVDYTVRYPRQPAPDFDAKQLSARRHSL
jgi:dipeptidyl aminopeptidase/acylaminoacyl peptidase